MLFLKKKELEEIPENLSFSARIEWVAYRVFSELGC
jgi:hypothetical protein